MYEALACTLHPTGTQRLQLRALRPLTFEGYCIDIISCASVDVHPAGSGWHQSCRLGSHVLQAQGDDNVQQRQPAPAAEAQRLNLPFESDMQTFTGGSTAGSGRSTAATTQLGPSEPLT